MDHAKDQHKEKAPAKESDKVKYCCTDKDKTPCKEQPKAHAASEHHKK
jgi:hypothetical protein